MRQFREDRPHLRSEGLRRSQGLENRLQPRSKKMKKKSDLAILSSVLVLGGCTSTPRPARTEVTPGSSEISTERIEQLPRETRTVLRVEPGNPQLDPPVVRVIITPAPKEPPK